MKQICFKMMKYNIYNVFAAILKKKRPHGFIQHQDFWRHPGSNSYVYKVHKNGCLQKSPGGCMGGYGSP